MPSSASASNSSRRRRRGAGGGSNCRLSCDARMGLDKVLDAESAYALSGTSVKCIQASCPAYTAVVVFLLVLYGYFLAVLYTFRPGFILKAGSTTADPNSPDFTATWLYALLFTAIVLIGIALIVRCARCSK